MPADVSNAIRDQSAQYAAGRFGADPAPKGNAFTFAAGGGTTNTQLSNPEEFANVIIRHRRHRQ